MKRCNYCKKIIWFFQYYIFGELTYLEDDFKNFEGLALDIYHLECFLIEEAERYGKKKQIQNKQVF